MKTHTNGFKEQIKLIGKEIDSRITFGSTVLGKDDLNAVTPSYQGAILKSVMKQLDIDSNVAIPIGTILKYEFGLKVNGQYEYINYGNYVVYSIEKQEDTNSYKIVCYDKLLYSMLDYVKLPITYPISIRDYINSLSTALGLKFANKSDTFANYDKQIQADLYDGLGYTFRDILDELAQVTASTICLNNNDELEIRYITETGDTIDEEFLKDVNVNFGEKFGAINTIVLSRSGDSDSVYYPSTLPTNPYEIKISDNQIMNGNDRADFLPDIYNKLNGLEFYTNDFVSTGIVYYDLCDRYSVKVGDNTYSCVMFNDEVLVTQGLEENIYTELPEQTKTDYKHASKDDRMINQVYLIVKKNEAEILAVINTTEQLQKEINPIKDESGSNIIVEDASDNPLTYLEVEGKSTQEVRSGKNKFDGYLESGAIYTDSGLDYANANRLRSRFIEIEPNKQYCLSMGNVSKPINVIYYNSNKNFVKTITITTGQAFTIPSDAQYIRFYGELDLADYNIQIEEGSTATEYEAYGASPSPDFPSEIESVGYENLFKPTLIADDGSVIAVGNGTAEFSEDILKLKATGADLYFGQICVKGTTYNPVGGILIDVSKYDSISYKISNELFTNNYITYYDENLVSLKYIQYRASEDTIVLSNAPTGTKYVSFRIGVSGATIGETYETTIQVEKGSIAHSHIPYGKYGIEFKTTNGTDTNTSLIVLNKPLRSLPNGVKDIAYIKNNKLYVDRKVGSVILDGINYKFTGKSGTTANNMFVQSSIPNMKSVANNGVIGNAMSSHFKNEITNHLFSYDMVGIGVRQDNSLSVAFGLNSEINTVDLANNWLSTNNTQVDYELATPVTEELGEIEMLKTLKGYNSITTTDELLPTINLTYVRDTIIADYVENHVTELKLTENEIKASVESVSSSVDGLNTTINRVEEITTDNSQVINVISTNIDKTSGEVREVTTTTGFTFNADGMTIDDGSGFKAEHTANGTYYKDGNSIVGQYTKDGSKQKDLELFGTYSYGKESIEDTPMFVGQLYTDANGERGFGHFYNGEG